jgi:hypothetical protein
MGASIALPDPVEKASQEPTPVPETELSLSVTDWDPSSSAFSEAAVAAVRNRAEATLGDLAEQRQDLEAAGPDLGLTLKEVSVPVPADWSNTPGSPAYYLRMAEGYLRAAASGTICRDEFPESSFTNVPPPPDKWICAHRPPHPR